MKFKTILILTVILSSFSLNGIGQTAVNIPKEFIETIPPKVGSEEWSALNFSENDFIVEIIDGNLEIKNANEGDLLDICELNISRGKLVGVNKYENGGILTFDSKNTSKSSVEIKQGNIKFIFNYKDKIYFIEGLEHLSTNSGALYELENTNEKFTYTKIIDFEDAPEAFTIYKDKLLVATHANFYVIENLESKLFLKKPFGVTYIQIQLRPLTNKLYL